MDYNTVSRGVRYRGAGRAEVLACEVDAGFARLHAVHRASPRAASLTNSDSPSLKIMRHESQNSAPDGPPSP